MGKENLFVFIANVNLALRPDVQTAKAGNLPRLVLASRKFLKKPKPTFRKFLFLELRVESLKQANKLKKPFPIFIRRAPQFWWAQKWQFPICVNPYLLP